MGISKNWESGKKRRYRKNRVPRIAGSLKGKKTFMTLQFWQRAAQRELEVAGHDAREAAFLARLLVDEAAATRHAARLFPERELEPARADMMRDYLKRLINREPWPHITGRAWFYGLELEVSPATLIPRSETETLVQSVLERLPKFNLRVADLGTGSGAIAIALSHSRPDARVIALEMSPEAREIAQRNVAFHSANVEVLPGANDWFSPLETRARFDVLVSNPPYISRDELSSLQPEVQREPRLALDGGEDGLDPYRVFASRGRDFLVDEGFCALELGAGQFGDVRALFEKSGWRVESAILDLGGIERVLVARPGD